MPPQRVVRALAERFQVGQRDEPDQRARDRSDRVDISAKVETRGVYVQDVVFPSQLVQVLTLREVANQQQATYIAEKETQDKRLDLEASRGKADMQSELAKSTVGIDIVKNKASAVQAEADGESYRLEKVGRASAVKTEAEGLAIAKGLEAQQLMGDSKSLPQQ